MADKARNVKISIPSTGYRHIMVFNRFRVETIENNIVLSHFGLVSDAGLLVDQCTCSSLKADLEGQKQINLDYLGSLGSLGDAPPHWLPTPPTQAAGYFNIISLTTSIQDIAEIALCCISGRAIFDARKPGGSALALEPIALLRSTVELHKHWLKDICK
jgi:hypothetical protein